MIGAEELNVTRLAAWLLQQHALHILACRQVHPTFALTGQGVVLISTCERIKVMAQCQYILENDLPPVATVGDLGDIRRCCEMGNASLGWSAKKAIASWRIHESQLRAAVIDHIAKGHRMFYKYIPDFSGNLLPGHVHGNVTLGIGLDVYVEIVFTQKRAIIIYSHDHTVGKLRLPK